MEISGIPWLFSLGDWISQQSQSSARIQGNLRELPLLLYIRIMKKKVPTVTKDCPSSEIDGLAKRNEDRQLKKQKLPSSRS